MRKLLLVLFALVFGFACGCYRVQPVHAAPVQIASPTILCAQGFQCDQYVVQVTTQRGFGRWQIFQVQDQAHSVDTTQLNQVAGGNPSTSVQFFLPAPGSSQTGTIAATQP
jgi:hypothetical protein